MDKPTKTLKQFVFADGTTEIIRKRGKWWEYSLNDFRTSVNGWHNVEADAKAFNATIETIPNPDYDNLMKFYNRAKAARTERFVF
jgi:hypothetical protein